MVLSRGWVRGFYRQHQETLTQAKGYHLNGMRIDDLTQDNIEVMYDLTYQHWVDVRIAVELPESDQYYVAKAGNQITAEKSVGRKGKIKVTHPDWILHGDEVSMDMCQESYGHVGGQTYLVANWKRAAIKCSRSSHRTTLNGLTAGNGKIVMFIIIFAAKEMDYAARLGYGIMGPDVDPSQPIEDQTGPGKVFPGAPVCEFRGKTIPAIVGMSPKGSIMSTILAKAIDKLDELEVRQRVPG